MMVIMTVVFTTAHGVSAAYIIKRLDNVVKAYAQSISSILITIACTVFFPLEFILDYVFIVSLILTIIAIFLNEHENLNWDSAFDGCQTCVNYLPKSIYGQYGQYGSLLGTQAVFIFYSFYVSITNTLSTENKTLSIDKKPLSVDKNQLSAENKPLTADNKPLYADNSPLFADNKLLSVNNNPLSADNKPLSADNNPLSVNEKSLSIDK